MNKKTLLQIMAFTLVIGILYAASWLYHNRSEAVYQRIINQNGYSLSLVKEGIAVDFFLKPEWIPEEVGETQLNLVIASKFDSDIVLEKVGKRDDDFYIQLNVVPHPSRTSGQLLNTSLITNNGFTTTSGFKWKITDAAGTDLLKDQYGAGEGPGNLSDIFIDDAYREKFKDGVNVQYAGYYLYGYTQFNKTTNNAWVPILYILLIVFSVNILYNKRSEHENHLVWKLIGYLLLGGFTFALNHVKLPLGFVLYLLFFRKPKPNHSIKHKAALFGLVMYLLQLVVPPMVNHFDSEPKHSVLRHVSIEQLGLDGVWKMLLARAQVSNQARVQSFETLLDENDKVKELEFELVDPDANGGYNHLSAVYHASEQSITLKRSSTEEWLQFSNTLLADNFINQVQELGLLKLKPAGSDHRYVKIELDSLFGSYAMKNESNFGVDEKGIYPIAEEQLPVTATRLLVCAPQTLEDWSTCEDPANYYFNIVEGGARE